MGVVETALGLRASFEARRACWSARAGALLWQPPPPVIGDPAAARRLNNGLLLFDGALIELAPDTSPWQIEAPDALWNASLHGHGWIDDLASVGDVQSRETLARWVHEWIAQFGQGTGPGWPPPLVARRLVRWIAHSIDLLNGASQAQSHAFFRALNAHARFLDRLWRHTEPGLERIETVSGMLYARFSLEGAQSPAQGIEELGRSAARVVGDDGAIASRNPQHLHRLVEILGWSAEIIEAAGMRPDPRHLSALSRLRPALAALAHSDGRLARFHGGRAGRPQALAAALGADRGQNALPNGALGFVRMARGGATLLMDGAAPGRAAGDNAHASALAIEFTVGDNPIVVNSGSGIGFGRDAEVEGRQTPAHSTLILKGESHPLTAGGKPVDVSASLVEEADGPWALGESHAWRPGFGLIHERRVHLDQSGTRLSGEDTVIAASAPDRDRLNGAMPEDLGPRQIAAHFIIHPDAAVTPALNGRAALIALGDGSRWMLRTDARGMSIQPARYFEATRVNPRATKLVVVTGEILEYWGRITWTLQQLPTDR